MPQSHICKLKKLWFANLPKEITSKKIDKSSLIVVAILHGDVATKLSNETIYILFRFTSWNYKPYENNKVDDYITKY